MLVRFHPQIEEADTVAAPVADSLALRKDSVVPVHPADTNARRLSPTELRDSRTIERSINVVKEKPYRVIRRSGTRRNSSRQ